MNKSDFKKNHRDFNAAMFTILDSIVGDIEAILQTDATMPPPEGMIGPRATEEQRTQHLLSREKMAGVRLSAFAATVQSLRAKKASIEALRNHAKSLNDQVDGMV